MNLNIFDESKDVFLDIVNAKDYVQLDRVALIYQTLKESVQKPLKMILLYGKPGTGKSMFLTKLHSELSQTQNVILYSTPILDEKEFYKALGRDICGFESSEELSFPSLISLLEKSEPSSIPLVLLDEAQLYSNTLMEKIRLISDTRKVKFVITLHKTEKEDLIAKEHFQTRIWESIELENASASELKIYIQKKLMKANNFDTANMFQNSSVNTIYSFTQGNYRDTNKLLYGLFEIYSYYLQNMPHKINTTAISSKIIEMAAIHTGLLDA